MGWNRNVNKHSRSSLICMHRFTGSSYVDYIQHWSKIVHRTCLVRLLRTCSTGAIGSRSSVPFYRAADERGSRKLDTRIRLVSIKNAQPGFHGTLARRRVCFMRRPVGRPTTEVIYEGNRTAHAPLNVLPSRQWWSSRCADECARGRRSAANL